MNYINTDRKKGRIAPSKEEPSKKERIKGSKGKCKYKIKIERQQEKKKQLQTKLKNTEKTRQFYRN